MQDHPEPILVDLRVYVWDPEQSCYVPYTDTAVDRATTVVIAIAVILAVALLLSF